jgi:hypothetical protein
MRKIIPAENMTAPRLELRWRKTGNDWTQRECDYNIVIPLREHDIRREDEDGNKVRDELTIHIGSTSVEGGRAEEPVYENGDIDTPFRDGAHALWDSEVLNGMPIYAVCGDKAQEIPPRREATEKLEKLGINVDKE